MTKTYRGPKGKKVISVQAAYKGSCEATDDIACIFEPLMECRQTIVDCGLPDCVDGDRVYIADTPENRLDVIRHRLTKRED